MEISLGDLQDAGRRLLDFVDREKVQDEQDFVRRRGQRFPFPDEDVIEFGYHPETDAKLPYYCLRYVSCVAQMPIIEIQCSTIFQKTPFSLVTVNRNSSFSRASFADVRGDLVDILKRKV
jgi:hypothetical protein